ncbi:MAG: ATP synthase F1 subunit gamma [Calditrichia bacterium]|nr:ATP synthase F1 subunit gamma [Calditrichia bacterium]
MATLREIRTRISSVKSTQQITKAMKMVASAKLRRAQEKILATRPYAKKLQSVVGHLIARVENSDHILLKNRPIEKILLVIVTADRGLCGAFNANIVRQAVTHIESYTDKEVSLFVVGKKGFEFFSKRNFTIFNKKINFFNHLAFHDVLEIVSSLIESYSTGQFDQIEILYNEFRSAVRQDVVLEQFLPFVPDEEMKQSASKVDYLYEPGKEEILSLIIPKQLNIQIWKVLLESNAAEQGARMTAMESATDNAEELISQLTLHYNRARQSAITKEISEIVGGAEALKEK